MTPVEVLECEIWNICDCPRGWRKDDSFVLVDRKTKFGNPHPITQYRTRSQSINECRQSILNGELAVTPGDVFALRGKKLVCHCAPLPCHAEIWKYIADRFSHQRLPASTAELRVNQGTLLSAGIVF